MHHFCLPIRSKASASLPKNEDAHVKKPILISWSSVKAMNAANDCKIKT